MLRFRKGYIIWDTQIMRCKLLPRICSVGLAQIIVVIIIMEMSILREVELMNLDK